MNKYWKSISLIVFTCIVFGIFYFQMTSYSERLPHFSFHKMEGDEKAVEPMLIQGDLTYSILGFETFRVGANGTEYLRDQSYFKRLEGYYMSEKVKQLQDKYKSFMRGKETHSDYYFENERLLAYAVTPNNSFGMNVKNLTLDILDKETKDRKSFEVEIPDGKKYSYIEVTGLQIVDNSLYIITKNDEDITGMKTKQSIQRYTIDIDKKKLASTDTIYMGEEINNEFGYSDMNVLFNEDLDNTEYAVMDFEVMYPDVNMETGEVSGEEETIFNSIEIYDIVTNEKQVIKLPEKAGLPIAFIDQMLYLGDFQEEKMHLSSYDVQEKTIIQEKDVALGSVGLTYMDLMYQHLVHDGKFYFSSVNYEVEELPTIAVIDLGKMSVDYIGEVEMKEGNHGYKDPKQGMNPYNMYFGDIELKVD